MKLRRLFTRSSAGDDEIARVHALERRNPDPVCAARGRRPLKPGKVLSEVVTSWDRCIIRVPARRESIATSRY
jgi:hypothetical protein